MSGIDIANLSYKELQALALRYRVPGNIKKQLLIEVLKAAKCGDEQEVDKLLAELRQTRKKRIRKGKPTKLTMSLASTPIHSPNYDVADEYYSAQHRLPYQWVGAEEEIPNRPDEGSRVPQYEEFRQFLLRRIQRDYQTYNTNSHGERVDPAVDPGSIMDLRNDQGESVRFETDQLVVTRATNMMSANGAENTAQSYSGHQAQGQNTGFDYQIFEDPNGNGSASFLLRRMLQAPVGANLGEIASPELQGCRIWNADYNQGQNNLLDNSDTLSANSEVNVNDDNDWPIGNEYYRLVNSVRDHLILQNTAVAGNQLQNNRNFSEPTPAVPEQFCGTLTTDEENPSQYQLLYSDQITNIPGQQYLQGHQQWAQAPTAFAADNDNVFNYQKLKNHESKVQFGASSATFYDAELTATNYATPRASETDPLQMQQQYSNVDNSTCVGGYLPNQNGFEGNHSSASATSNPEMKLYQNLNEVADRANPDVCSGQIGQNHEANHSFPCRAPILHSTIYYADSESQQQTQGLNMQHMSFFSQNQQQLHQDPPPAHNGYVEGFQVQALTGRSSQVESETSNRPSILGEYHNAITNKVIDSLTMDEQPCQSADPIRRSDEPEGDRNKTVLGLNGATTVQSESASTSLEVFWPQRSEMGEKYANNKCLENILNLRSYGYVDYSRIDQTSCIYCYSAPIVTQRLSSTPSLTCSQKKRFIAEIRQHTFSPYWLLYNDTASGMRMSRDVDEIQDSSVDARQKTETIDPRSFGNAAEDGIVANTAGDPERARNNDDDDNNNNVPPSESRDPDFRLEVLESKGSLLESIMHIKSDGSTEEDSNDPDETESSFNLNMENSEQNVNEDQNLPPNA